MYYTSVPGCPDANAKYLVNHGDRRLLYVKNKFGEIQLMRVKRYIKESDHDGSHAPLVIEATRGSVESVGQLLVAFLWAK